MIFCKTLIGGSNYYFYNKVNRRLSPFNCEENGKKFTCYVESQGRDVVLKRLNNSSKLLFFS